MQKTVEVPQLPFFVQEWMPVVVQRQVLVGGSRQCRCAVLGQGCLARCYARLGLGSRRAENCRRPTVAVPDPGGGDARGDSTGAVLVLGVVFTPVKIPQVQLLDQCLCPSFCQHPWRFHRCSSRTRILTCPCYAREVPGLAVQEIVDFRSCSALMRRSMSLWCRSSQFRRCSSTWRCPFGQDC